jgi:DNA invertase Pin-like site-specific DNA recombinase
VFNDLFHGAVVNVGQTSAFEEGINPLVQRIAPGVDRGLFKWIAFSGQEVENQLRQLREFATAQGWTISREYVDHETGKTDDRAEFQAMFRDASQRRFDVLLFWALDRLSREGVLETLQHLNRLTSYGVGYRSFTEQYFDSCGIFKDAVIAIIATVAKQERVRISLRVKAGLETARAKGKRLGRPRVIVDRGRIGRLRAQGLSWAIIAAQLGVGEGTVYRLAHASAKNPLAVAPVSPCAVAAD